ncbi:chitin synthase chs-2-like [Mercenaria mercenaria]|uniref:chitin synthase chs-2-like n=1 Tax=Mercenaria mercenaria TaxID=6596 RepID=UPI00234E9138|nr:chitin synthase chs-2-like [Mercenaria mercenaria]
MASPTREDQGTPSTVKEVTLSVDGEAFLKKNEKQSTPEGISRAAISLKAICTLMFCIVLLGCFVWTKLSFLALAEAMHDDLDMRPETRCRMFVMLQIMILFPNVFNLFRGLWKGYFRKDVTSPDRRQVFMAVLISFLEATGICLFTFNIPGRSKTHHVILLISCVFVIPLVVWTVKSLRGHNKAGCDSGNNQATSESGNNEPRRDSGKNKTTAESGNNEPRRDSGNNQATSESGNNEPRRDSGNNQTTSELGNDEPRRDSDNNQTTSDSGNNQARRSSKCRVITALVLEIIALGITAYWLREAHIQELLMAPIGILFLSVSWTSDIQSFLVTKKDRNSARKRPPTWKLVAIMAIFKLLLTFGISYMIFAIKALSPFPTVANMTQTVAWSSYTSGWDWTEWQAASDQEISYFISHIVCGVTGYMIATTASKASMQKPVLIPALIFCSPISIILLVFPGLCDWILIRSKDATVINDCIIGRNNDVLDISFVILAVALFLLAVTFSPVWVLWKTRYLINLREDQLFWIPSYNSIFLDQWIMLNRKNEQDANHMDPKEMSKRTWIYICTTMFRETEGEMKQYLESIRNVQKAQSKTGRNVEAHIFFDDAFEEGSLNKSARNLIGLVKSTLNLKEKSQSSDTRSTTQTEPNTQAPVNQSQSADKQTEPNLKDPDKIYETPYGQCHKWTMKSVTGDTKENEMPFNIHFKDKNKVKSKKRWSQIMYMSYVLDFLSQRNCLSKGYKAAECKEHSYFLVTDADVKFTHESVEFLIDLMLRDPSVGAACARTYPLGSGPLVWYQEFEYAIGHWFQKAAENVLGTVLCSPGCFSIYRRKAVQDVLPSYAEKVESAADVLTKDMGEDRWFCTLLVQSGWFIEYCAVASNKTHCPENFEEFFKQRRRWIGSTLANLLLLLKKWDYIKRHNDRVSSLFRVYQAALLFASLVGPSTIILIVSGGLKYGWDLNIIPTLLIQLVLCFTFGTICILNSISSPMKISAAKFFTIFYAIVMIPVLVGMAVQITTDFIHTPNAEPNYIDASIKVSTSTVYLVAMTGIFVITGILHTMEMFYLFHGIWYLLCLPGGYLILMIYSICNITDSSWGTREMGNKKAKKKKPSRQYELWSDLFSEIYRFCSCCARKVNEVDEENGPDRDRQTTVDNEGDSSEEDTGMRSTTDPEPTTLEGEEADFWTALIEKHLKPKTS